MKHPADLEEQGIDLNQVYQALPIALCIVGRDGRLLAANELHSKLGDRPVERLIGVRVADLHQEGGRNVERDFRTFDAGRIVPNHELIIHGRCYMVSVSPVRDSSGVVVAISVAHFDITEAKETDRQLKLMNRKLRVLSTRDHLTKLNNRRMFDGTLRDRTQRMRNDGESFALIVFDVDHFKLFNDRYGHQKGDKCLKDISACLRHALKPFQALLFRYGGEEFAAILPGADVEGAFAAAMAICAGVRACAIAHEGTASGIVTVSCGVSASEQIAGKPNGTWTMELVRAADLALYDAKSEGRDTARTFNPLRGLVRQMTKDTEIARVDRRTSNIR